MTTIPFFQIDAFAEGPFGGNPAAVMPLPAFLPDATLQSIAAENNLAETAFIVAQGQNRWALRWFTPALEVPLCGHATLAAAFALFDRMGATGPALTFSTLSGDLTVTRLDDGRLEMDFPADPPRRTPIPDGLAQALGATPREVCAGQYLVALFDTPDEVRALAPDLAALEKIAGEATRGRGNLAAAAPGDGDPYDVVSRFFAPGSGIPEDPATGSAHCILAPLFADRLGKPDLLCFQAYPGRGGVIGTGVRGARVILRGRARLVIEGAFHLD
jgi:PhzF family phenazine biosynthesis protein